MLGQSGKMRLTNGDNTVTVTMDNIYELDADGNAIANTGSPSIKHSLQTFAPVDFTINDTPRITSDFGVPASGIDFNTTLVSGAASLLVSTYIFHHNGVIHPTANESWTVAGGTVKFSLQIGNWPFCSGEGGNPCQGATGAFLQFGMEIKGSADASLPDGEKRFTLATDAASGNNITLELSDEVLVDGQWVKMPAGFPRVDFQGSKQLFTFRLPRFSGSALYDPIVSGLGSDEPPSAPPPLLPPPPSSGPADTSPPSASAPPLAAPSVSLRLSASGNVEDYTADVKAALASAIAEAAGPLVQASAVTLEISTASVIIAATITTSSGAESASVLSTLQDEFADAAKATAVLRQAVPTITILEAPTISRSSEPTPSSVMNGAVIGAAVGAVVALVILAVTLWRCCRRGTTTNQGSLAHGAATIKSSNGGPCWSSNGTKTVHTAGSV